MTISILGIGLVCSFYTSVGGIKAVVWTDVLQILVIFAGSLALLIQGVIDAGGWEKVFETSRNGRRMPYFEWNPNPTVRHSFCSTFIGGFFTFLTIGGSNQATIQRYLSTRSIRSSQIAVLGQVVLSGVILCLSVLTGLVIYARYHVCDPFLAGKISKLDKIVPLFMMETLGFLPGLPGLFVACLFSAALSTVSSGVNSLAAVTMVDFLKPGLQKCTGTTLSARTFSILTILIAILYGLVTIGVAYLAGKMGKEVIQIALSIFGMIGGPLLGLMSVGIFFPCINSWGAGAGLFVSLVICLWAGIGPIINPGPPNFLPLLTSGCKVVIPANMTTTVLTTVSTTLITTSNITSAPPILESRNPFRDWYSLSYLHYATVSVIVSVFIGLLISAGTGFNRHRTLDPRTFYDVCGCYKGKPSTSSYDLRQLDPYMPRQYKDKPQEYENPGFYNNNVKRLDERDGDPYYY